MKLRFIYLAPLISLAIACNSSDTISISGSSTVLPVVSKAAESYNLETNIKVTVNSGGSGAGFNQLANGQTDIGMMSRDITKEERETYPQQIFKAVTIGIDAVVPVVSSEVYEEGIQALSLEQIAGIYRGEFKNWKELGGPDREILVVDKETSRGTRHIFMEKIMGNPKAEAAGADLVLGSNNEEQTALTQSNAAIGMLSSAWINNDVKGLSIIDNKGDSIPPSLEAISQNKYPITRELFVVVRDDISPKAKAFVEFLQSEKGQNFVTASGYVKIKS